MWDQADLLNSFGFPGYTYVRVGMLCMYACDCKTMVGVFVCLRVCMCVFVLMYLLIYLTM